MAQWRGTGRESVSVDVGVCPSNPSLRGKGDAGRCEAGGSKKREAYSLEYVEGISGRERRRCLQIVCRSRMAWLGQTPSSEKQLSVAD
jgi:hypothetical protein